MIFWPHCQFDSVHIGKPVILMVRRQGDKLFVHEGIEVQKRLTAELEYLEILHLGVGFPGIDYQILFNLGAAGKANPLF